jgi:1-acyl-sn-glycerol-3-phosphate acyltransferase
MSTPTASRNPRAYDVVLNQDRYNLRRRLLRDYFLRPLGFRLLVKADITGLEHIPPSGPTLLVMNHIAALDPFVVTGAVTARDVVPMSKIENYRNPLVAFISRTWGVYPVRRGEVDRQALASTIELLQQNRPVLIAPEGTRRPALSEAKDGMTYVATKANAVVVPIGLDGTDQFPAAYKRLRRPHVVMRFGRAFRFRAGEGERIPRDVMHEMTRQAMLQIALLLPEHRRGFYSDVDGAPTDLLEFIDPAGWS